MVMVLRKKIGQMISAGFPSPKVDDQAVALVKELGIGNFFLFARNIENGEQVTRMCCGLNKLAYDENGICPFISIDQEGGAVSRITGGAALYPGAMALGASGGKHAYQIGVNSGRILRAMGITTTASPVLDVNIEPLNPIIGARAYGDDPDEVLRIGKEMMRGLTDGGVIATIKHYPGHGNVKDDSHLALPGNDTRREILESTEWKPFAGAIAAGAEAVMSAHVVYTDVDSENPATLSKAIITDLLRNTHGFNGVATTDCMEMDAVGKTYGSGEAAVRAIEAGCDLLTVSHTLQAATEVVEAIENAVISGRLSEARIDESVARIRHLKEKHGLLTPPALDPAAANRLANDEDIMAYHLKASMDAITVVSDDGGIQALLNAKKPLFVSPLSMALSNAEENSKTPLSFAGACAKALGGTGLSIPINEWNGETEDALMNAGADVIVFGMYNARFREGQIKAFEKVKALGKPVVAVLLGAPYDAKCALGADAVMATYEYTVLSVEAFIKSVNKGSFPGMLPVKI